MFTIKVKRSFSAAHRICGYEGNCANLHGHNWKVRADIRADCLDKLGMACDFRLAKSILKEVLDDFDHCELNSHPLLSGKNPTSERIAMVVFERINEKLPDNLQLVAVEVFESEKTSVEYRPEGD